MQLDACNVAQCIAREFYLRRLSIVFCLLVCCASSPNTGGLFQAEIEEVESKLAENPKDGHVRRMCRNICSAAFLQAFALTFLAEWGDRSQIATVSLAAHDNALGVTIGAIAGHAICTGAACVGGELLARKISMRAMAVAGGMLFFVFAVHQFWSAMR
jgi:Ca2+/H+ antiporter, TMEM165/GDT1 family